MWLGSVLSRFLRNRDGGVAPMLALAALPMFGLVGAAVDYSRAASARTAMQAALDATALMLSKDAQTISSGDLIQRSRPTASRRCSPAPKRINVGVATAVHQPASRAAFR